MRFRVAGSRFRHLVRDVVKMLEVRMTERVPAFRVQS